VQAAVSRHTRARDADVVRLERLSAEHPTLASLASSLLPVLDGWTGELQVADGASAWMHHNDFAERTEHLAGHLTAAITLADDGQFASSMVVTRTALEHHVIDRLLLLADRYIEIVRPEDPSLLDQWDADWVDKSEPWTRDVISVERVRNGRAMRLVRSGHSVRDGAGNEEERISPYWVALQHYDAFVGHPHAQAHTVRPFDDIDHRVEWATRNQALYGAFLRWSSLCSNLQLNDLVSDADLVQLQVHYSFLSAFTHATSSGYHIDRRSMPGGPSASHVLGELALLYATAIAIAQIDTWVTYARRRLHLLTAPRDEVLATVDRARDVIGYFWFLGGEPQAFDRYQEANRRAHPRLLSGERPTTRPEDLDAHDIGYYANPFERVRRMHAGEQEMTTGFSFAPMWRDLHW
jgi:hypothetical protein